ncbi:Nucleolar protein 16 [Pyricularia oryzae]|uniref:Nucleolar protein 16 n=3 Tax=Pyricularia TaxID=48558 RepID=NOP16_PYRO7|nr:uncharacterized protein MGG_07449 [Pyricularia oryzae 70-15]A4R9U5.2 RecName: Full=Nucleolar protein 16 [Pyricularia oryzae 70-15]KAH8846697.1 Nucleolar protein 16 [Pyricularia oryzae]KAI6304734.1 Nucleolar protein 16 [Pyricularia grisea]EHA51540.1 hypothetical protein MGG_07449 [Pyricularia oryzae 70-15]KAH9428140.1 Nucleolar protein 16 [Pyricularia oryzae]KAI6263492.1 Nucleolar protein 16 [Pyricularia oryzae]
MGRTVRQKRKNRSSRPKVKQTNRPKKALNPLGNDLIAKNWNKKETLTQNYRRLGLLTRLQAPTGGVEPGLRGAADDKSNAHAPLGLSERKSTASSAVREVRVKRDAEGRIVSVINEEASAAANPLDDPLNELETDSDWEGFGSDDEAPTGDRVVDQLERMARVPRVKTVRGLSEREVEWLESLVAKHGDNVKAMERDHRLNPMQQTAADISRRLRRLRGE